MTRRKSSIDNAPLSGEFESVSFKVEQPYVPGQLKHEQENTGHSEIKDALSRLSPEDQAVLRPQFDDSKSTHETALIVGMSTSDVEEKTDLALGHLKELLEP